MPKAAPSNAANAPSGNSSMLCRCSRLARPRKRSVCLGVQHIVPLRRTWWPAKSAHLPAVFGKGLRVFAAALEAGPVPGGKRGWLVKKVQLGVGAAPDVAPAALEVEASHLRVPPR
jgi:hypothetical protein